MLRVHIEKPSPRARYVIEHIIRQMLGWEVVYAQDYPEFQSHTGPKLYYGSHKEGDHFWVEASGWLDQTGISVQGPPVRSLLGIPQLFPTSQGHDLFAGAFYLLSRYEEYLGHGRDEHGRFPSAAHFVVEHGLEDRPFVDLWALQLAADLRSRYPALPAPQRTYSHWITVDVDNGLKYLGRPFWKQGAAALRDLVKGSPDLAAERIAVLRGARKDPFQVHDRLAAAAALHGVERVIAFILVQGGKKYDHAADVQHPGMQHAIEQLAATVDLGIHPSYDSSTDTSLIGAERDLLGRIAGKQVAISRQHFLRWRVPETLRVLEQLGITEEHSLGFSDRPGFRAGTCTPFRWYDLQQERVTDLVLHPFATMDSALHDHMGLRPSEAAREMARMSDAVRAVKGRFISVWHDRFISGHSQWAGWPEAFHEVVQHAAP